jgi:aconitate hydratase
VGEDEPGAGLQGGHRVLRQGGLTEDLEALGFHTVGYGCTTCIGNSGPLPEEIEKAAIKEGDLVVASVLSGNRNFEGRVHPRGAGELSGEPAAGGGVRDRRDRGHRPAARADRRPPDGRKPVYLKDIWPTHAEIQASQGPVHQRRASSPDSTRTSSPATPRGTQVPVSKSELYPWDDDSTYIQNPPFFEGMAEEMPPGAGRSAAPGRCAVGDSVTTDHISPAGRHRRAGDPAGQYLLSKGVKQRSSTATAPAAATTA